jgi:hypothetical protein
MNIKKKIAWILWLLGAAALHLFGNNAGTLIILAASVIIPVLSAATAKLSAAKLGADLTLPQRAEKGEAVSAELTVINNGFFAAPYAEINILCENLFTGEKSEQVLCFSVRQKSAETLRFAVLSDHCGRVRVSARRSRVFDLFGIFSCRAALHGKIKKEILVAPEVFMPRIILIDDIKALVDSDEYSMAKPGPDPSETFAIREYIPGDPIKSIHWKLSQKSDNLMMREFGLPIVKRALVLLENTILPGYGGFNAASADALAGIFTSVSLALTDMGITHAIGWRNTDSGMPEIREIKTSGDIEAEDAMGAYLSCPVAEGGTSIAACYSSFHERCAYAHVVFVSLYIPPDTDLLRNGNKITVLLGGGPHDLYNTEIQI